MSTGDKERIEADGLKRLIQVYPQDTFSRAAPRAALTDHRPQSRRVLPLSFIDERPRPAFSNCVTDHG